MKPLASKMLNILIIGYGSIGQRHHKILKERECTVKVLSRRQDIGDYQSLEQALEENFDLIVIANETSCHLKTLCLIQEHNFQGHIFVEKPLALSSQDISPIRNPERIWVGYNLRFHPAILTLKPLLDADEKPANYAHFHVGQALSTWRHGRDFLKTYSAHKHLGGGVLHDLSHEIDLVHWLFGSWNSIKSVIKKCSNQTVDSEDLAIVLAQSDRGSPLSINMNYLDITPTRFIQVSLEAQNINVNLVESTLEHNGTVEKFDEGMAESYQNMWAELLDICQGGSRHSLCNFSEARDVLESIKDISSNIITKKLDS